jgi:CRP-like cAMP-binding protein
MYPQETIWETVVRSSRLQSFSSSNQLLALREVPLFQAMTTRHLKRVAALAAVSRYHGAPVVRAGTRGDAFHVILAGTAQVRTPDGYARLLQAGDSFGELALLDGAPRAASVVAVGELITARIARAAFLKLLRDEPAIAVGLARGLVQVIRDLQPAETMTRPADTASPGLVTGPSEVSLRGSAAIGWLQPLRDVPLFRSLNERQVWRAIRLAELKRYAAGATVVRLGARGDSFHIILDGRAEVRTPDGQTRVLTTDDYFGELALLDGAPRAATVVALDGLTTARLSRPAFLKLLRDEPAIAVGLVHGLVRMIRDLESA